MNSSKPEYYRHRFPAEIMSRCLWLYFRFSLSYRDVEEMMAERGVAVSYETIRCWRALKFDQPGVRIKSWTTFGSGSCTHMKNVFWR